MIGRTVGPYRVLDKIGVGGMGEVYRATDTNLGRQVAIKVLPAAVAQDAEHLARFDREARTLASLNHPNIAQIYGIERSDGVTALVMELVEGEDLSQVIARGGGTREAVPKPSAPARALSDSAAERGAPLTTETERVRARSRAHEGSGTPRGGGAPRDLSVDDTAGRPRGLPVDDALAIARQVADALEVAHEQGIIHRDLKPANVKVRADGTVKVLDFGLAKALVPATVSGGPTGDSANSPTITSPALTQMGMILGTAAYMAPEQARGRQVDRRADIWAFGCVLYEMLTGQRAFPGDDVTDTLAAVVRAEPDWSALPADWPPAIATYLRRCLHKDPRQRLQAIGDMRLALDGAFEVPAAQGATASTMRVWQRPVPVAAAAVGLIAVGLLIGRQFAPVPPNVAPVSPQRVSVVLPPGLEYQNASSPSHGLAVSPDGRRIVFRGRGRGSGGLGGLYYRTLDALEVHAIPGAALGRQPFFAPDGSAVAFFADDGLKRVSFDGRPPLTLADDVAGFASGVWRDDGIVYTGRDRRDLFRVPDTGGTPVRLAVRPDSGGRYSGLAAVRETGDLLYGVADEGRVAIELLTPDGEIVPVLDDARLVGYVDSGHLLFARDGVLMTAAFDTRTRRVGTPTPMLDTFAFDAGSAVPQVAISAGTLAYVAARTEEGERSLVWVDADGTISVVGSLPAGADSVDLSPDGTLAIVGLRSQPRRALLWDLARQVPAGLQVEGDIPRWHPDGRHVAVSRGGLRLVDIDDGSETVVVESGRSPSFAADGTMAYQRAAAANADIFALLSGETTPRPIVATAAQEHSPALSPDGRWLAWVEGSTPMEIQVYVARFPSGTGRRRVTATSGYQPLWRHDSRALFFYERRASDSEHFDLRVVTVGPGEGLTVGAPQSLFGVGGSGLPSLSATFLNSGAAYQATPDGRRFLMVQQPPSRPLTEIVIVQHWDAELRRVAE